MSGENKTDRNTDNSLTTILLIFIVLIVLAILGCYIYTSSAIINSGSYNFGDSFVGTMATVIGVLVTFVIGYQIYNAVELNDKLKKYDDRFSDIENIKNDLLINNLLAQIETDMLLSFQNKKEGKYDIAFNYCLTALYKRTLLESYNNSNLTDSCKPISYYIFRLWKVLFKCTYYSYQGGIKQVMDKGYVKLKLLRKEIDLIPIKYGILLRYDSILKMIELSKNIKEFIDLKDGKEKCDSYEMIYNNMNTYIKDYKSLHKELDNI